MNEELQLQVVKWASLANHLDEIGQVEGARALDALIAEAVGEDNVLVPPASALQHTPSFPTMDEQLAAQVAEQKRLSGGGKMKMLQGIYQNGVQVLRQFMAAKSQADVVMKQILDTIEAPTMQPETEQERDMVAQLGATYRALTEHHKLKQ